MSAARNTLLWHPERLLVGLQKTSISEQDASSPFGEVIISLLKSMDEQLRPFLRAANMKAASMVIKEQLDVFMSRLIALDRLIEEVGIAKKGETVAAVGPEAPFKLGDIWAKRLDESRNTTEELVILFNRLREEESPADADEVQVFEKAEAGIAGWLWASNALLLWGREGGPISEEVERALIFFLSEKPQGSLDSLREMARRRSEEDASDLAAAREAEAEGGFISLEDFKRTLS